MFTILQHLKKPQAILMIIVVIAALTVSGYFIWQKYSETQKLIQDPTTLSEKEVAKTIEIVGKLILLPQGEVPTVATVSDVTKLQDQPFFANAINGDRVLIYQQAKKAVLYRPADNKIIEVAPVNVQDTPVASESAAGNTTTITTPTVTPKPLTFAIYNGTTVAGLSRTYESVLLSRYPGAVVTVRDNAKRSDYSSSYLVPVTDIARAQGSSLREKLGLQVSSVPEGEIVPANVDFLIILGSDQAPTPTAAQPGE